MRRKVVDIAALLEKSWVGPVWKWCYLPAWLLAGLGRWLGRWKLAGWLADQQEIKIFSQI